MALRDFFNTEFALMDYSSQPDGFGGIIREWTEGARFFAGFRMNTSTEMQIAEQEGTRTLAKLVFDKGISLRSGDLVKRISDGAMFEVTSLSEELTTPPMATTHMAHSECFVKRVKTP